MSKVNNYNIQKYKIGGIMFVNSKNSVFIKNSTITNCSAKSFGGYISANIENYIKI